MNLNNDRSLFIMIIIDLNDNALRRVRMLNVHCDP